MVNTVNWISIGASTSRNFWTAFSFIQRKRLNAIDFVIELKRMRETRAMHIETGMQCILYVNYPIFLHDINSIFDISSVCIFCFCCFKKYTRTITLAKIEQSGDDKKLAKCSEERKKGRQLKTWRKVLFCHCCRSDGHSETNPKITKRGRVENFHSDHCPWGCEWHLISVMMGMCKWNHDAFLRKLFL